MIYCNLIVKCCLNDREIEDDESEWWLLRMLEIVGREPPQSCAPGLTIQ